MSTEHIPFDLEWAKYGAPFLAKDKIAESHITLFAQCLGGYGKYCNGRPYFITKQIFIECYEPVRMATREECEQAGVEYIEKPVSAHELAELRKDSARLDYLAANCLKTKMTGIKIVSENGKHYYRTTSGFFESDDIREAIDAVMDDESKAGNVQIKNADQR